MLQLFCPTCGTFLFIEAKDNFEETPEFFCKLCPYKYDIKSTVVDGVKLKKKAEDFVLTTDTNRGDRVDVVCPKCSHDKAYFTQIQTRSADEASTIIYDCCNCGHKWRDE